MSDYDAAFDAAGRQYNVDPRLLKTVFQLESGSNSNTPDSAQGAQGGMQMLPATAAAMGASNPRDMTQAIPAAAKYLSEGLDATGTPAGALAYYHGGPDRSQWGPKTAAYVAKGQSIYPTVAGAQPVAQKQTQAAPDAFSATLTAPAPSQGAADPFSATMGGGAAPAAQASDPFSATLNAPAPANATTGNAPQTTASGIGASILRGVHDATDVPATALAGGADWVAHKLGYNTQFADDATNTPKAFNQAYDADPNNQSLPNKIARFAGDAAVTMPAAIGAGKLVEGVADVGGALSGANRLTAVARPVASGAAQGATVAAMNGEPIKQGATAGAVGGAILGGIGAGVNKLMATDNPAVQAAIEKYGIPLRAGQVADSKFVRYMDSQAGNLPGTGMEASNVAQRSAFNRAVSQTFGEKADKITPAVMQSAKDRIGSVFQGVADRTTIPADQQLLTDLGGIESNAAKMPSIAGDVAPHITDILETASANNGVIPGKAYQALVGKGSALERAQSAGDPTVRNYANEIREALDDAFQRAASPEDAQALAKARWEYKNMMTVAPLVNKGAPGDINPLLLQGAANRSFKQNAFKGAGDLGELGDIGQTFLRAPPDSGTATRALVNSTFYGDTKALARTAVGATAGRAAASVLRSNPLTGPAGIPGSLPAGLLLRNRLLDDGTAPQSR